VAGNWACEIFARNIDFGEMALSAVFEEEIDGFPIYTEPGGGYAAVEFFREDLQFAALC